MNLGRHRAILITLAVLLALLGLCAVQFPFVLSTRVIGNLLTDNAFLGLLAIGMTVVIISGGIDLSVGPLTGFLVVVASFFIVDGQTSTTMAAGFALMFVGAFAVGAINGVLVRYANFTPIAATLAMFIGL